MPTVVICPGFATGAGDYIDGICAQQQEIGFKGALERRGFSVKVVPIERHDWMRIAFGLFDPAFWTGTQLANGLAYGWYLQRVKETVESCSSGNNNKVLLVGHSAGGWLARAALGHYNRSMGGKVCGLVTLGTPQVPPPKRVNCVTRGALKNTNDMFPGAFMKGVRYVTVAGNAITSSKRRTTTGGENKEERVNRVDHHHQVSGQEGISSSRAKGTALHVARINYEAVLGESEGVQGDGFVPVAAAHLSGAEQITLDGVSHFTIHGGAETGVVPTKSWYGSEDIIDKWLSGCVASFYERKEEIRMKRRRTRSKGGVSPSWWRRVSMSVGRVLAKIRQHQIANNLHTFANTPTLITV